MAGPEDRAQQDLSQQDQAQPWQTWAEAERARRQRALRDLAQRVAVEASPAVVPNPSAPMVAHAQGISLAPPRRLAGPRRRLILAAILAVIVVAGAGTAVLHVLSLSTVHRVARPVPTVWPSLTIVPSADGLSCLQDAVWSPDGSRIAVLGYQWSDARNRCPDSDAINYAYEPGLVAIFSATTGALLSQLSPDRMIIPALHLKAPHLPTLPSTFPAHRGDTSQQVITYTQVLWSADGSRLALLFSIDRFSNVQINGDGSASEQSVSTYGMLVAPVTASRGKVLLGPAPDASGNSTPLWEWDLAQGQYIPEPVPADPLTERTALPQALGYSWNPDGTLMPVQPLVSGVVPQTPPAGPVGDPTGDPSFTIWQPGHIAPDSQWGPGVYQYQTRFSAWSPDGRYLYPNLDGYIFGELQVPAKYGPSAQDLAAELSPAEPLLPLRDKALGAVMAHGYFGNVAWSPNGRLLSLVRELGTATSTTGIDAGHVHLYDCATGAEVASLTHDVGPNYSSNLTLRWSADSARVFMLDTSADSISVWMVPKTVR